MTPRFRDLECELAPHRISLPMSCQCCCVLDVCDVFWKLSRSFSCWLGCWILEICGNDDEVLLVIKQRGINPKLAKICAAFWIQFLVLLWLTKSSSFRQSWKSLSSMRANCPCIRKVTIKGFWCWLWPFGCVTQWHKCWMLWVGLLRFWLLSWGSCHDNPTSGGECPAPEFLQWTWGHWHSEWLWNIAGTRDHFLYFCRCLLLSQWVKYANGANR